MKLLCALLALVLIPSLIAGPDNQLPESVSKLLHKPQLGPASLALSDGTRSEGATLRVTDEFVTFRRTPQVCENVELSRITGITRPSEDGVRDVTHTILWWIVLSPLWLLYSGPENTHPPLDPILGSWESVKAQTTGRTDIDRIAFRPAIPDATPQDSGYVTRMNVVIQKGTYRVDGGALHLTQLGRGLDDVIPLRHKCDTLVAATSNRVFRLKLTGDQPRRASPPIVGVWIESLQGAWTTWQFKSDGAYQINSTELSKGGAFAKTKKGIKITFPGAPSEQWDVRRKSGHLFISIGGNVTEYQKRPATR
jgi:hypothetical protein